MQAHGLQRTPLLRLGFAGDIMTTSTQGIESEITPKIITAVKYIL